MTIYSHGDVGEDWLQLLLVKGARRLLHAHWCHQCGNVVGGCYVVACPFRPFDVNPETKERYMCENCKARAKGQPLAPNAPATA